MLRLGEYSPYFTQREDALGLLAYGSATDSKLARSTALVYRDVFVRVSFTFIGRSSDIDQMSRILNVY
jgi:hypothetical protein